MDILCYTKKKKKKKRNFGVQKLPSMQRLGKVVFTEDTDISYICNKRALGPNTYPRSAQKITFYMWWRRVWCLALNSLQHCFSLVELSSRKCANFTLSVGTLESGRWAANRPLAPYIKGTLNEKRKLFLAHHFHSVDKQGI